MDATTGAERDASAGRVQLAASGPAARSPMAEARLGAEGAASGVETSVPLLLQLRWLAAFGQAALLVLAWWVAEARLPYTWMWSVACVGLASNAAFVRWPKHADLVRSLPAVLTLDTLLLTVQLALSGGPHNPFTAFYVVYVALAAVTMSVSGTAWIAALSGLCYASMFRWHLAQPLWESAHGEHSGVGAHLIGMWLALSVVAAVISYFVSGLARQLVAARAVAARNERLASLTALAAGAAHELGSPLGTIAVAAHEIEVATDADVRDDARLIRAEVNRCRRILDRMSGSATLATTGADAGSLESIAAGVRAELGVAGERLQLSLADGCRPLIAMRDPIHQALAVLIRNALDASEAPVELRIRSAAEQVLFEVIDCGSGISAESLARVGEPFFTTKEPGRGTGLGLYVVRMIAERFGGQLILRSAEGLGTEAILALPRASLAGG
jgi:two-component system, sensor histidine kinase RegB